MALNRVYFSFFTLFLDRGQGGCSPRQPYGSNAYVTLTLCQSLLHTSGESGSVGHGVVGLVRIPSAVPVNAYRAVCNEFKGYYYTYNMFRKRLNKVLTFNA